MTNAISCILWLRRNPRTSESKFAINKSRDVSTFLTLFTVARASPANRRIRLSEEFRSQGGVRCWKWITRTLKYELYGKSKLVINDAKPKPLIYVEAAYPGIFWEMKAQAYAFRLVLSAFSGAAPSSTSSRSCRNTFSLRRRRTESFLRRTLRKSLYSDVTKKANNSRSFVRGWECFINWKIE